MKDAVSVAELDLIERGTNQWDSPGLGRERRIWNLQRKFPEYKNQFDQLYRSRIPSLPSGRTR